MAVETRHGNWAYAAAGAVKVDATEAETEPTTAPRMMEYLMIMPNAVQGYIVVPVGPKEPAAQKRVYPRAGKHFAQIDDFRVI